MLWTSLFLCYCASRLDGDISGILMRISGGDEVYAIYKDGHPKDRVRKGMKLTTDIERLEVGSGCIAYVFDGKSIRAIGPNDRWPKANNGGPTFSKLFAKLEELFGEKMGQVSIGGTRGSDAPLANLEILAIQPVSEDDGARVIRVVYAVSKGLASTVSLEPIGGPLSPVENSRHIIYAYKNNEVYEWDLSTSAGCSGLALDVETMRNNAVQIPTDKPQAPLMMADGVPPRTVTEHLSLADLMEAEGLRASELEEAYAARTLAETPADVIESDQFLVDLLRRCGSELYASHITRH